MNLDDLRVFPQSSKTTDFREVVLLKGIRYDVDGSEGIVDLRTIKDGTAEVWAARSGDTFRLRPDQYKAA